MIFNDHSNIAGLHAFLGPSKPYWSNYSVERLEEVYVASLAAQRGTELHKLAHDLIRLGQKLPRTKQTLCMYVNDVLGFRMKTEVTLFYSADAFGTADAIGFTPARANQRALLRVYDLKTGRIAPDKRQLYIYAALFFLEYSIYKPFETDMDFRFYHNDEIIHVEADPEKISHLMDTIVMFDQILRERREALSV